MPPPWWEGHEAEGYIDPLRPREIFYGDVDPAIADDTYVICEKDEKDAAMPPAVQERLARRAQRVERLDTSHSPFLSQPAQLADLLRKELTAG